MSNEAYYYLATDYFATGEGSTKCLMITRAYPRQDDYETAPSFDAENLKYDPGKLKYSKEEIAKREFADTFGSYMAHGVEVMDRDSFFARFGAYIPATVEKVVKPKDDEFGPGNFKWHTEFHINFS